MKQTYHPKYLIADLTEHPENPNRGDMDLLKDSIEHHGFYGAVLVQKSSGHIIAGNHRTRAAAELGETTVPVIVVDVDDDQARRIMLMDNKARDVARSDDDVLRVILSDMDELAGTGYTDIELAALLAAADTSGFAPMDADDQPRLDQQAPILCPQCAFEWRVGPGGEIEPV